MKTIASVLDVETGRQAAQLAALNVLVVTRTHLGSLDEVTRIVRLGVSVATSGDVRDQPKVADAASELLQDVFGKGSNPVSMRNLGTQRSSANMGPLTSLPRCSHLVRADRRASGRQTNRSRQISEASYCDEIDHADATKNINLRYFCPGKAHNPTQNSAVT